MYRVEINKNLQRFTEFLHRVGFWNRQEEETVAERRLKLFYSIFFSLLSISLVTGAILSDDMNEKIVSILLFLITLVDQMKLFYLIWKKKEILELFNGICNYSIDDGETYVAVNYKSTIFKRFSVIYLIMCYCCLWFMLFVAPFAGTERKLFLQIWFPLDWKKSEFGFWLAFLFLATEAAIAAIIISFVVFAWYLMANCSWQYEVLSSKIKGIGNVVDELGNEREISMAERDSFYNQCLVDTITSYNSLKEMINQLASLLSELFVVQLTTGALCICMSIYSLIFVRGENFIELLIFLSVLIYCFFDIFMIMYFGNEIKLASGKLSFNLYESNWIDRSQSVKKNVIIFGEFLMQPHQLMILKIYPLTLETFTRILNTAFSMFNILKNFK